MDVWEGGILVPGFAHWPGRIAAGEVTTPVHIVDWFPTLASLIEYDPEPAIPWDGVDLSPLLFGDEPLMGRDLYWTWNRRTNRWAVRRGDWKVVKYGSGQPKTAGDWQALELVGHGLRHLDGDAAIPVTRVVDQDRHELALDGFEGRGPRRLLGEELGQEIRSLWKLHDERLATACRGESQRESDPVASHLAPRRRRLDLPPTWAIPRARHDARGAAKTSLPTPFIGQGT